MIKRLLLFLITMAVASSSIALTYSSKTLEPGKLETFTWTTGEVVADSVGITNHCGAVSIGFYAATGGTAAVYAVPDANTAALSGILLATLSSSQTGTTKVPAHPVLKIRVTGAPSAGVAKVFMHCSDSAGSGSGGTDYFGDAMPAGIVEPAMREAATRFLFDEHMMNPPELSGTTIALIDPTDFASIFGPGAFCQLGTVHDIVWLVNDMTSADCTTETGGGALMGLCACRAISSTAYGATTVVAGANGSSEAILGGTQHYWGYSNTAPGEIPKLYPPSVYSYERPQIRVDPMGANGCSTAMEASHEVHFGGQQKPAWFARVSNNNPGDAQRGLEMQEMLVFVGWSEALDNAGFSHFIDPAGTTPATALIEGDIRSGFGFLWIGPSQSWYTVWIRNSVLTSAELVNFPGAMTPGTAFYNYIYSGTNYARIQLIAGTMLGGFGFDSEPNLAGTKWAAYSIGKTKKSPFVASSASLTGTTGNPQTRTGYYRVFSACGIPGATSTELRMEMSQMDVIK